MVLTSTQVDEDAQHFYRKLGYRDCGGFVIDVPGYEQPMELFLSKAILGKLKSPDSAAGRSANILTDEAEAYTEPT